MFIHTQLSAPKRFAMFGRQTQTFCKERVKNGQGTSFGVVEYFRKFVD